MTQLQTQTHDSSRPSLLHTEPVARIQQRFERGIETARSGILRLERGARDRAYAAGRATDDYVHRHPWQVLAAAAAVGVLIGVALKRR